MRNKVVRYLIVLVVMVFLGYHSIYFKNLDELPAATTSRDFQARNYARNLYDKKLPSRADSAIELGALLHKLRANPQDAFRKYSNASAIGNLRYFLVKGEGTIASMGEDAASVQLKDHSEVTHVEVATEFVYGNSIRDASGLVDLKDFSSTVDFNGISEGINEIIRKEVLPPFKSAAKPGMVVQFTGAIELNLKYLELDTIEVVPIRLTLIE